MFVIALNMELIFDKPLIIAAQVRIPAGRVEILRQAGEAGWNTGQILLSGNQKTSKHQSKYTYIFHYK